MLVNWKPASDPKSNFWPQICSECNLTALKLSHQVQVQICFNSTLAAFTGSLNQNLDPTRYYNNLSLTSITIVVCSYCPLVTTLVVLIVELHCSQNRPPCHSSFVKYLFFLVFRNLSPDVIWISTVDTKEPLSTLTVVKRNLQTKKCQSVRSGQSRWGLMSQLSTFLVLSFEPGN